MNWHFYTIKNRKSIEKKYYNNSKFLNLFQEALKQYGIDNLEIKENIIKYNSENKQEILSRTSLKANLEKGQWLIKENAETVEINAEFYFSLKFHYILLIISTLTALLINYWFFCLIVIGFIEILSKQIILRETYDYAMIQIFKSMKENSKLINLKK